MTENPEAMQVIKIRDDHDRVLLSKSPSSSDKEFLFSLQEGHHCSWLDKSKPINPQQLRQGIEPWLTALLQSEHLSLLVGSGLTHGMNVLATGQTVSYMEPSDGESFHDIVIKDAIQSARILGREEGNIEDQIRSANELLRGLEILSLDDDANNERYASFADSLRQDINDMIRKFSNKILESERMILEADESKIQLAFSYLVSFLMSFASRTGTRDRLHIFTTNYDRLIEAGSEAAGLHLVDRFTGTLAPIFRSSRLNVDLHYNPPGIRGEPRYLEGVARFTKLHGSLDWIGHQGNIRRMGIPLGAKTIDPYLDDFVPHTTNSDQVMIYPNAAKDRETSAYPYVDLFRDFASSICQPNHTLVAFGYSFGDEHINRIVKDMLTIPSTHLVIISHGDPLNKITEISEDLKQKSQVSLLLGDHIGNFQTLVEYYLPKPAIDRNTFRMVEILRSRWASTETNDGASHRPADDRG